MEVKKAFKYRIYPTKEQEVFLAKHFGAKRFVFNYFLNQRKNTYLENKKTLNYYDNAKSLTILKKQDEFTWMKEINSQSLQSSLRDLDVAYNRFFSKKGKFPRFKSRRDKQSFRVPQFVSYSEGKLHIPKLKSSIRVKEDRPLTGDILFATISKTSTNKYFVAITCETEHMPYIKTDKQIGIDLGIKTLAVCSDDQTFENGKTYYKYQKKIIYRQRQLSRKNKGSSNRSKQRLLLAKIHEKIRSVRSNHLHQITTKLVRENQTICFEDLTVINMMKNHCLAKSISDVALGEFIRQIEYKCKWNEREAIKIGRFFPSSKTCYECGFINQDLKLSDRKWICPRCEVKLDRDLNASKNILREGLNIKSGSGIESDSKQKPAETLPLGKSVTQETQSLKRVG